MPNKPYHLLERDENGATILDTVVDDFRRVETLDPRSIKMLEIVPKFMRKSPGAKMKKP